MTRRKPHDGKAMPLKSRGTGARIPTRLSFDEDVLAFVLRVARKRRADFSRTLNHLLRAHLQRAGRGQRKAKKEK